MSAAQKQKNSTLTQPFIVKKAASTRLKSVGFTSECSYTSSPDTASTPINANAPSCSAKTSQTRQAIIPRCSTCAIRSAPAIPKMRGMLKSPSCESNSKSWQEYMMSNPAVQSITAAVSSRIRQSRDPRIAIQAAAGAIPSANPSTRCDKEVNLFVNEYTNVIVSASGESQKHSIFNCFAANTKTKLETSTNPHPNWVESSRAGICRPLVLGFLASIGASTSRLNAIAADRAATIATTIHIISRGHSGTVNPLCRIASNAPVNAKGNANTECSNLIMSSVSRTRFQKLIYLYCDASAAILASMNEDQLRKLLDEVRAGAVDTDAALTKLRHLPFEDIGFAKVDHHRALRHGMPEVVFGLGKSIDHVVAITDKLLARSPNVLITRATKDMAAAVLEAHPDGKYYPLSGAIRFLREPKIQGKGKIAVVCAGTSDIFVAEEAQVTAETMGNEVDAIHDIGVAGIHRLLSNSSRLMEARVAIVCAGMEGALPSVVGGLVACPVIAVPTSVGYGASFHGLAALLGMLNSCASNVTVVNIDNGFGAGYVASLINRL